MVGTLNEVSGRAPNEILQGIREDVDAFAGEMEQFDDLTMLCLEYRGTDAKSKDLESRESQVTGQQEDLKQ